MKFFTFNSGPMPTFRLFGRDDTPLNVLLHGLQRLCAAQYRSLDLPALKKYLHPVQICPKPQFSRPKMRTPVLQLTPLDFGKTESHESPGERTSPSSSPLPPTFLCLPQTRSPIMKGRRIC